MKRHIRPVAKANGIHKPNRLAHVPTFIWHIAEGERRGRPNRPGLLRQANSRITLDVYTQTVNSNKRAAQSKVMKMMISNVGTRTAEIGTADSTKQAQNQARNLVVPRYRCHSKSIRSVSILECMAWATGLATSAVTGNFQGAIRCALKMPKGPLKLLI